MDVWPRFHDPYLQVWIFRETSRDGQASSASADDDVVEMMARKLLGGDTWAGHF